MLGHRLGNGCTSASVSQHQNGCTLKGVEATNPKGRSEMKTNMSVTVRDIKNLAVIVAGLVREGVTFEVDNEDGEWVCAEGDRHVWVIRLTGGF